MLVSSRVLIFQVSKLRTLAPDVGVGSEYFITHMGQALKGRTLSPILLVNSKLIQERILFGVSLYGIVDNSGFVTCGVEQ
jgi:hypothetical protein